MARVSNIVHSEDACTVILEGNKHKRAEPSSVIVKFPGGHVEVTRCTDGTYWAHIGVIDRVNVVDSRIDYDLEGYRAQGIPPIPCADRVQHIAVKVAAKVRPPEEEAA